MCCAARAVCVSLTSARYLHCTSHRACALFTPGRPHDLTFNFCALVAKNAWMDRNYTGHQERTKVMQGCAHDNHHIRDGKLKLYMKAIREHPTVRGTRKALPWSAVPEILRQNNQQLYTFNNKFHPKINALGARQAMNHPKRVGPRTAKVDMPIPQIPLRF